MWFEGTVLMKDFPERLAQLMQTVPPGASEPMWRMVSSNIGTTVTDDGYVFHSEGTSGKDSIYVGVKNAMADGNTRNKYSMGHRFFIAENYTPDNQMGVNGVFNNLLYTGHSYAHQDNWNGSDYDTYILQYRISITKDRIILITSNGVAVSRAECVRGLSYLGLMKRYSDELDSTACVIATNYSYPSNSYANIRVLRNKQLVAGAYYAPKYSAFLNANGLKGWGGNSLATHIPLHSDTEGYRGELDGMLVTSYMNAVDGLGRSLPEEGFVTIEGKEYFCVYKTYYHLDKHNNFDDTTKSYLYLIEKK